MQVVPELRPLGVGDIVDRVFGVYRARFGPLLAVSSVPYLAFALAAGAVGLAAAPKLASFLSVATRFQDATGAGARQPSSAEITSLFASLADLAGFVVLIIVVAIAFTLVQSAALVRLVASTYLGQPASVGDALRTGLNAFPRLLLMGIVAVLAFTGLWVAGIGVIAVVFAIAFGANGAGALVLVAVALIVALLFATVYLQASWMVSPAIAILENAGPLQALGRAWRLSGGSRWRILALQLLLTILQLVLSSIVSVVLLGAIGSDQNVRFALQQGVNLLANIAWAPIYWGTFAVLYYDLRVRKEALDLQLAAEALPRDT